MTKNQASDWVNDRSSVAAPVSSTARRSTARAPLRSRNDPSAGEMSAPSTPPTDTAAEIDVRDQLNSRVIGSTKMDNVPTAEPWRENPARHTQARITQP